MTRKSRPHVVHIGPHPSLVDHTRRADVGMVLLDTVENLTPDAVRHADHVLGTDYTDVDHAVDLIGVLGRRLDVRGVLALTEKGLLPAARINAALGYEDNPVEVVERVMDKRLMRAWLADDSAYALPAQEVGSADALRAFADRVGTPTIVKPADGAGSAGVRMLHDLADVQAWKPDPASAVHLAERYVHGREFSVEACSLDGEHLIVAVTEKAVVRSVGENPFVEVGHTVPACLDLREERSVRAFVQGFLQRMGIRQGLTHTEVILGPDGPVVIETHTRNGGDHIADLVLMSTGLDLRDLALQVRCGFLRVLPAVPEPAAGAAIRYFTPAPGVVGEISGMDAARFLPGVVAIELAVAVGDEVAPLRSSFDRVGYVMATGEDARQAAQHCQDAMSAVTLGTG